MKHLTGRSSSPGHLQVSLSWLPRPGLAAGLVDGLTFSKKYTSTMILSPPAQDPEQAACSGPSTLIFCAGVID